MKIFIALLACLATAAAFDCYGRNNTCADSHMKCDTGYTPFCEHHFGPEGRRVGFCTCDKACNEETDCKNQGADGCPPEARAMCDMRDHVCLCLPPPPHDNHSQE